MAIKLLSALFLLCFSSLQCESVYAMIHHHAQQPTRGFFSNMDYVFRCIEELRKDPNTYRGFEVDFEEEGLYYDPLHGPNYWSYYFQPCQEGTKIGHTIFPIRTDFPDPVLFPQVELEKFQVYEFIQSHIHLKDDLEEEIQNFVDLHFKNRYVIGVHYRGTDKKIEARRLTYKDVLKEVLIEINNSPKNWHIFVATDEQPFLQYMLRIFPGHISYLDIERSDGNNPLHSHNSSPYHHGKTAVMDAILLSRTNTLLRTCSNLSRWSTYFNPWLKERELSKLYWQENP